MKNSLFMERTLRCFDFSKKQIRRKAEPHRREIPFNNWRYICLYSFFFSRRNTGDDCEIYFDPSCKRIKKYRSHPKAMFQLTRCARSGSCLFNNCVPSIFTAANEHGVEERVLQKVERERKRGGKKKEEPGGNPTRPTRTIRATIRRFHPRLIVPPPSPRDKRLKEIQNSRKSRSHGKAFVANGLICLIFCVEERPP